jgi:hypothetical protein
LTEITVDPSNTYYMSDARGVLFDKARTELIRYPAGNAANTYTIPAGVTSIGDWAFSGCAYLTRIELPTGLTSIDDYAFRDCAALIGIDIPAGLMSIGDEAFYGCDSLTDIELPDTVTSIGHLAF